MFVAKVKAALARGKTKLLQPMETVTFLVSESLQGEVNGLIARNEGYVTTTGQSSKVPDQSEIEAILPSSAISDVSEALRATSAGEGTFTACFSHYQPVPDHLLDSIVGGYAGLAP